MKQKYMDNSINTSTSTAVKTSIPVTQKISIGIMMLGALSALFAIALGLYEIPIELKNNNAGNSLLIKSVSAASVVTSYNWGSITFGGKLENRSLLTFGTLNQETGYQKGNLATQEYRFFVKVKGEKHRDAYTYDDMLITITTNKGVKNICLSASENTTPEIVYYVDVNGNTYEDFALKNRSNPISCPVAVQSMTKSFQPDQIQTAVIEYLVTNDLNSAIEDPMIDFLRENTLLATLRAFDNVFYPGDTAIGLKAPLTLQLSQSYIGPGVFPARRVLLNRYNGDNPPTEVICIPEITVPRNNKVKKIYYDTAGNAYHDLFLTSRVTTESCDQTFAKPLIPNDVVYASISSLVPEASEDVALFRRGAGVLGWLGVKNNVYTNISQSPEFGTTLHLENLDSNFPARTFTIETDDGSMYDLCYPDKSGKIRLYYGTDLNPYPDETLFFGGVVPGCDKLAPVALMISPSAPGEKIGKNEYTFVAQARDNMGIDKVKFVIDDVDYSASTKADQPSDHYYSDVITLTNGVHTVYFQATDPSGNIGKSENLSFEFGAFTCGDGTLPGQCNSTMQYCDPATLVLVNNCNYCDYECPVATPNCEASTGVCKLLPKTNTNKAIPIEE